MPTSQVRPSHGFGGYVQSSAVCQVGHEIVDAGFGRVVQHIDPELFGELTPVGDRLRHHDRLDAVRLEESRRHQPRGNTAPIGGVLTAPFIVDENREADSGHSGEVDDIGLGHRPAMGVDGLPNREIIHCPCVHRPPRKFIFLSGALPLACGEKEAGVMIPHF